MINNRSKVLISLLLSALLLVAQYRSVMALTQQCQSVLDRYHSGVTPQTLTPLSGRSALYIYQTESGHCGWGTGNKKSSQPAAQELAYSKCKRHEDLQRSQSRLRVPCTLVGLDGGIIAAGMEKFAERAAAVTKTSNADKIVEPKPSPQAREKTKDATSKWQEETKKQLDEMTKNLAEQQKALQAAKEDLKRQQEDAARDFAEKAKALEAAGTKNSTEVKILSEQQQALKGQQEKLALAAKSLSDKQKTVEQQQANLTQQQARTSEDASFVHKLLAGIILPPTEDPSSWMIRVAAVPVQQQQFCRIVDQFYDSIGKVYETRNDIKRNSLFRERQQSMAALLPRGEFSNWVVKVKEVTQAADGSAAVMLQPPCRVMLGSDACQKNGSKIQATIASNSPVYRELEKINSGDFVVVSGKIVYAESNEEKPLPTYAIYRAGSHCSAAEGSKQEDVFVTDVNYLVHLR